MNNQYFTICDIDSKSLVDSYKCCVKMCMGSKYCINNCARIFPPDFQPKQECAIEQSCWNGNWLSDCLETNKHSIITCCENKCNLTPFIKGQPIDCKTYCNEFLIG